MVSQSFLDYIATVGYDVDFLRGDALDLLAVNPIIKRRGAELFDPCFAPLGTLAATGPWAARLLQGGGTFIDELAGGATWSGSLDLPASARHVGDLVSGWMEVEAPNESHLISCAGNTFPLGATAAEQFYSLRDTVHFTEQWLPGTPASRPALTILLAFCIGVDEFFCPIDSLDTTVYLGRRIRDLWDECLLECDGREDAAGWLALARDALRSSVFLQNREKLVHLGLIMHDKNVFTDWDTTAHYMVRAEAAMTPFVGFCLCAYSGLPFHKELAGAVGLYCYGNAIVLDFCKRATRLGGGNYTEVALHARSGELQGRSQLIGSLLAYGERVLPPLFLCVLRPYVLATSSVVDVLDRYRERSWGVRLPLGQMTLFMMSAVMEGAKGSLNGCAPPAGQRQYRNLVAEAVGELNAWGAYNSYAAQPSTEGFFKLPRPVRLALQLEEAERHHLGSAGRCSTMPTTVSWMQCLSEACPPQLPQPLELRRGLPAGLPARLPNVRTMEATGLGPMMVRSPARPGGYAANQRDFLGRPAGAGPLSG